MLHENWLQRVDHLFHSTSWTGLALKVFSWFYLISYFYALKIPETEGLGSDICFLGAKEDVSNVKKGITATCSTKLTGDNNVRLLFALFMVGR